MILRGLLGLVGPCRVLGSTVLVIDVCLLLFQRNEFVSLYIERNIHTTATMNALLLLIAFPVLCVSQSWQSVDCPGNDGDMPQQCSLAPSTEDRAISIFFQKDENFPTDGGFQCGDAAGLYCGHSWAAGEIGSVGSCYFLLPAGYGYNCSSTGGATLGIQSAAAALLPGTLSAPLVPAPSAPLQTQDAWVSLAFLATGLNASQTCTAGGDTGALLCAFASSPLASPTAPALFTCNGFVPQGSTVSCNSTGHVRALSSSLVPINRGKRGDGDDSVIHDGAAAPCPPPTGPTHPTPNDCDCAYSAVGVTSDTLVTVVSTSVDEGFNSFHCAIGGTNVCAWGSNSGMQGSLGSCTFLLPAGQSYACLMEWGAAAFPIVQVSQLAGATLFPTSTASTPTGVPGGSASPLSIARLWSPGAGYVHPHSDTARLRALFNAWRAEHGVQYSSPSQAEGAWRAFVGHVATAERAARHTLHHPHLDSRGRPVRFNRFADMPRQAWERAYRGKVAQGKRPVLSLASHPASSPAAAPPPAPPPVTDWRAQGVVTPVKDQGQCGSCWSFSTTGALESAWALAGNPLQELSEQWLVSCANASGLQGCDGGYPDLAMQWTQAHGAVTEDSYPYASGSGTAPACDPSHAVPAPVVMTGHSWLPVLPLPGGGGGSQEEALLAYTAAYGPVSILVDAMTQLWWTYTGGVLTGCCDSDIDHAVLLVGYNLSAPTPYYLIKNSWAESWGEKGYVRLQYGLGECGINVTGDSVLPTVQGGLAPAASVWSCPPDATAVNASSSTASCLWYNGTSGFVLPPPGSLQPYCAYFSSGYMGYSFPSSLPPAQYPCPPSFVSEGNGSGDYFCVLQAGSKGFLGFPPGAQAVCDGLVSNGTLGYSWPAEAGLG